MITAGHHRATFLTCVMAATLFMAAPDRGSALDLIDVQELVDESRLTFARFVKDPKMTWLREHAKEAQAIFIAPEIDRLGYFIGAVRGKGVLLVKDEVTGLWSDPAFLTITGATFGLQIGLERAQAVALIMTKRGVQSFLGKHLILGTGIGLTVGPIGGGVGGATTPTLSADMVTFANANGVFAGLVLKGLVVTADEEADALYYGRAIRSADILTDPVGVTHWYSTRIRATVGQENAR
jgi:lipid-binding SYLF domain-containing protein